MAVIPNAGFLIVVLTGEADVQAADAVLLSWPLHDQRRDVRRTKSRA